jgi:hypothetical protein
MRLPPPVRDRLARVIVETPQGRRNKLKFDS